MSKQLNKEQYEATLRDPIASTKMATSPAQPALFCVFSLKLPHPELFRLVIMFATGFADVLQWILDRSGLRFCSSAFKSPTIFRPSRTACEDWNKVPQILKRLMKLTIW